MRNPDRIDPIIDKLNELWRMNPDLRLAQLVVILCGPGKESSQDIFATEDDVIEAELVKRLAVTK
jgi:uncharacterized protein YihD (DUF1040 family)